MLQNLAHWLMSLSMSAAAIVGLATTQGPIVGEVMPTTPEEISTSLHYKIADLRAQIERDRLETEVPFTRPMTLGSKGDGVERIQELLYSLDFLDVDSVTGYFGPATKVAVDTFQKAFQLPDTGVIDKDTLESIFSISISRMNLASIYFPEENSILDLATSSEALLTDINSADTSVVTDTSSIDCVDTSSAPTVDTATTDATSTTTPIAPPPPPAIPAAPSTPTALVISGTEIDLSWKAVTGAATYNLYLSTTSTKPSTAAYSGITGLTKAATSLKLSTTYHFWLTAVNAGGESASSAQVNATTRSH